MKKMFNKYNLCWILSMIGSYVLLSVLMSAGIIDSVYQTVVTTIIINIILAT